MKDISTIGIDLAKHKFRVVGMNGAGKVVLRKWVYRSELLDFMVKLKKCLVGMEACAGAHYWAREFGKMGHTVKLMPPQYVKPYVKTNKNDDNDAEGCCEAVTRPTMRFAAVKNERQQVLGQWHRVRERQIKIRTALGNEIRGLLGEFGILLNAKIESLGQELQEVLEQNRERLAAGSIEMFERMNAELKRVNEELAYYDNKIELEHKALPESQRLDTIPGVGGITATAIVALFSSAEQFKNGRQFGAFLGLTPRQNSTGGKPRLGRISKRGDEYIRRLLVQGAQSVLKSLKNKQDPYSKWVRAVLERRGWCKAAVAIANKNARIAWAILARGVEFDPTHVPVRAEAA